LDLFAVEMEIEGKGKWKEKQGKREQANVGSLG